MDSNIEFASDQAEKRRFCAKCSSISAVAGNNCPGCGTRLETVTRIRITGALSVLPGAALLIFMGWPNSFVLQCRHE